MFSSKMTKYSYNAFLEKHLWVTASACIYEKNTALPARIHLFKVKIEKLEGEKYVQS